MILRKTQSEPETCIVIPYVHVCFHDSLYKQIIVPDLEPSCSTESAVSRTMLSLRDCTSGFLGSRYLEFIPFDYLPVLFGMLAVPEFMCSESIAVFFLCPVSCTVRFRLENKRKMLYFENERFQQDITTDQRHGTYLYRYF
jgi:hypothetical protein